MSMNAEDSGTARSVFVTTLGTAFPPFAALLTAPILARGLGVDARGQVAAAQAVALLTVAVASFGLPEAVTHFVARGSRSSRRLLGQLVLFTAIVGTLASVGLLLLSRPLSGGNAVAASLIEIAAASVLPALLLGLIRGRAAGYGQWTLIAAERITGSAVRLVLAAALLAVDQLNAVSATLVVAFGPLVGCAPYLLRRRTSEGHWLASEPARRSVASYSFRIWIGAISGTLLMRIDQSLLLPIAAATQLGLYAVAVAISEVPLVVNSAVRDVVFARHSRALDPVMLTQAARVSFSLSCLVALATAVLLPWGLPLLFGKEFGGAVSVTAVLLMAVVLGTPGSIAGAGLSAMGRPGLRSAALTAAAVVNVIALLAFAPAWGALGAAVATLLGNLVSSNLNILSFTRLSGSTWKQFYSVGREDVAVVRFNLKVIGNRMNGVQR